MAANQHFPLEAIALLNTHRTEPWPPSTILTDDFAPYDLLMGQERSQRME